jgi:hypothetical protein
MPAKVHEPRFHLTLKAQIDMLMPTVASQFGRIFNESLTKARYCLYLQDLYHSVKASCPLMTTAMSQLKQNGSEKNRDLIDYLEQHIDEERHHDDWILEDLEHLGVDRQITLARPPKNEIVDMVGAVYYRILHIDPVAIFGYIAVLESHPVSGQSIDLIMKAANLDADSVRALKHHSVIDVDHAEEFYQFLSTIDLSDRQKTVILDCSKATLFHIDKVAKVIGQFL